METVIFETVISVKSLLWWRTLLPSMWCTKLKH